MAGCSASLPETHTHTRADIHFIHIDPAHHNQCVSLLYICQHLHSDPEHPLHRASILRPACTTCLSTINPTPFRPAEPPSSPGPSSPPLSLSRINYHHHPHHGHHHPQGSILGAAMCFCKPPPRSSTQPSESRSGAGPRFMVQGVCTATSKRLMQVFIIPFDNGTACTLTAAHVQAHFCEAVVRSEAWRRTCACF